MEESFGAPISAPIENFFIETNTIPLRYILMGRRLMYYKSLMQKEETELVKEVYNSPKLLPVKKDWVLQLQKDLLDCNISLSAQ